MEEPQEKQGSRIEGPADAA